MQQYPSYEEYKKTDLEWLGEIPKHWNLQKLRYLTSKIGSGVTPSGGASVYQKEGVPLIRSQNVHFDKLDLSNVALISARIHNEMSNSKVLEGDILLNITGGSLGRCYYIESNLGEANVNQHVCILRPNKAILTKYLYLLLRSEIGQHQIWVFQKSSGREGLNFQSIKNFYLPIPPISEQKSISQFLDHKTRQIQQFISKKQQHIQLLQEHKAAIINKAVTKGIDSNVALKDSGIEEIGAVPEHWEVVANRYILKERNERSSDGKEMLLMVSQQHGVVERAKYHEKAEVAESVIGHKKCYVGDLVLNRFKAHLGVFFKSEFEGLLSPDYTILSGKQGVEMKFYEYLFRHPAYVGAFIKVTKGIVVGLKRLYTNDLFQIKSLLPPHTEQLAILDYIQNVTSKIDESITKIQQQIQLIEEYQQSLIAQAVTGKIDVRKTRF